jgi:hypothetical protein
VGGKGVYFIKVNFPCLGRPVSRRIQGGEGNKCLYPKFYSRQDVLASKLVFGSMGLVLGSSMALIPPETTSIFLEGKIHRYD